MPATAWSRHICGSGSRPVAAACGREAGRSGRRVRDDPRRRAAARSARCTTSSPPSSRARGSSSPSSEARSAQAGPVSASTTTSSERTTVKAFVLNRHGRLVFPSSVMPQLDFSTMESLDQLDHVIRRDFETKAPSGTDILHRIRTNAYGDRYALMRDLALNLFWANRFSITMYDKRPTRWADLPRTRPDVFLPVLQPWEDGETKVAAVEAAYPTLPPRWDGTVEDRIFGILFDVFANRKHHATTLPAIKPTVAQFLERPGNLTFRLPNYDPDFPVHTYDDILDCDEDVPELEALHRWAMVLHNQYPWERSQVELAEAGQLKDDDYVVVFEPRDKAVRDFLRRLRSGVTNRPVAPARESQQPVRPYPEIDVRAQFTVMPRIEALTAIHGDQV